MSIKVADMEEEGVSPAPITTSWEKTHVFFSAGTRHLTFTITEKADIYMSTNVIDAYFTCDANSLTLLKVTGSQSSAGYVKVGSHAYMPGYHETVRITQTGNWVDARNEVMFGVRESVGLPLSAILGVSMDIGGDWMQKAILRGFKTEGLGHVCEIAEVTMN